MRIEREREREREDETGGRRSGRWTWNNCALAGGGVMTVVFGIPIAAGFTSTGIAE